MRRVYSHRGIDFAVTVNGVAGRRFHWSFEVVNRVAGKSDYPASFGLEYAFARGISSFNAAKKVSSSNVPAAGLFKKECRSPNWYEYGLTLEPAVPVKLAVLYKPTPLVSVMPTKPWKALPFGPLRKLKREPTA